MNGIAQGDRPGSNPNIARASTLSVVLRVVIFMLLLGGVMFLAAGTWRWPMAWAFVIAYGAVIAAGAAIVPQDVDLIEERTRIKPDVKPWDKVIATLLSLVVTFGAPLVAALDVRLGAAPSFALWIEVLGLIVFLAGYGLITWSIATNRFFARYVRIQSERGHHVISDGPYQIVRHPGYVGTIATLAGIPLALGSWWALALSGLTIVLTVIRTALEDQTLQRELPGYTAYTQQTRYRLLPGIW